jgi:hypothetical protein
MPGEGANSRRQSPALISSWPTRYLSHGNRNDHPFVFIVVFVSCRRRSAEVGEVLHGHASPAGFWRREFAPSPGNERGLRLRLFNFFTASLFQKGKKWKEFPLEFPQALLPLKKGGREGFLARPFRSAKLLPYSILSYPPSHRALNLGRKIPAWVSPSGAGRADESRGWQE